MRRLRVLLFDDDDAVREMVAVMLRSRGYAVQEFADPSRCPVIADEGGCACPDGFACGDLVITDVRMPGINGIELLRRMLTRHCRIDPRNMMAMSGMWTDADAQRVREMGCRVMYKPFRMSALHEWLDECDARIDRRLELRDDV